MGTYDKGILGAVSGKIGTVIGSRWKGIRYLKSLSGPRKGNPSEAQLQNQARFAYGVKFLQPLYPVLSIGYRTQINNRSQINAALSDLLTNAIAGDYPDYNINYERVRVAKGSMEPPKNTSVQYADGVITFSWQNNSESGDASEEDMAMLVAIGPNVWPVYDINSFSRLDQSGSLTIGNLESGQTIYCYMAYAGRNQRKTVSNSVHVGSLTV